MKSLYTMVGMKHRQTETIVSKMTAGEPLLLVREPSNPHDPNAVAVVDRFGLLIAYVKGTQARELARLMDSEGTPSLCAVFAVTADRWPQVELDRS